MNQAMQVLTSQTTAEWYTPPEIIAMARIVLGGVIDLDPATAALPQTWIQARWFLTADDDGLTRPWWTDWIPPATVWLNPPFDATPRWIAKLEQEYQAGRVRAAVLLVNSAPGYRWWEELLDRRTVVLLRERVRFVNAAGVVGGQAKKGQTLAYYGTDTELFVEVFGGMGRIVRPGKTAA